MATSAQSTAAALLYQRRLDVDVNPQAAFIGRESDLAQGSAEGAGGSGGRLLLGHSDGAEPYMRVAHGNFREEGAVGGLLQRDVDEEAGGAVPDGAVGLGAGGAFADGIGAREEIAEAGVRAADEEGGSFGEELLAARFGE
jgi:hypothetical protein